MWRKLLLVLIIWFVCNLGFGLQLVAVEAAPPLNWWSMNRVMQENFGSSGFGGGGFNSMYQSSPRWGAGFQNYGYNNWNQYAGPTFPMNAPPSCSLQAYNYLQGPPTFGGGWDGAAYGTYVPWANGLYDLYGYNLPNPFHN